MGGKYLISIALILMVALSGCSLFVEQEQVSNDLVCIPKSKAIELNLVDDNSDEISTDESPEMADSKGTAQENPDDISPDSEVAEEDNEEIPEDTQPEDAKDADESLPVKTYTEGDLISLKPVATDADGDKITFTFTSPLDDKGEWQTKAGDAGEYIVTVTASDGKSEVSKKLRIVVEEANSAPVISVMENFEVNAGETVTIEPAVTDAEGDEVTVTFSGWMSSSSYTTNKEDAGVHLVTVSATDGKSTATKDVYVTVKIVNHAPILETLEPVTVKEGETARISASADDEDGDAVTITYGSPLDKNGEWQTEKGDEGTYLATVTASDGQADDSETVTITVVSANNPPVIELSDVEVTLQKAGKDMPAAPKKITLEPKVSDADGDDVTVTYSGFMTSESKEITESDAGTHEVEVTASDGESESTKTITVTVSVNTAPDFTF